MGSNPWHLLRSKASRWLAPSSLNSYSGQLLRAGRHPEGEVGGRGFGAQLVTFLQ